MSEVVLDMPFDEADGSTIAYDLSPGHHHAAIEFGRFVPGRFGNCAYFSAVGKAEIVEHVVDFSQDFTFMIWLMAEGYGSGPTQSYALFKFPGLGNFKKINLVSRLANWTHITITQAGDVLTVYQNGTNVGSAVHPTGLNPTGFAVLNNSPHDTGGFCRLDGGKVIQGEAIPPDEIIDIIHNETTPVEFYINSVNLKNLGVTIERMEGVLDMPERKDPLTVDWEDYHGEVVDLLKPVWGVREIDLHCWIKGTSADDFQAKWLELKAFFEQGGTTRLQIDAGTKPLLFEVYHKERLELDKKKWRDGVNFGRFTMKLREPEPIKKVLKVTGSSCSITVTSQKLLSIYWGDGARTMNVYGTGVTVSHSYAESGTYYVVIAGVIEDISSFSTDAAVIWNKI